jgi:plastocyanin
MPSTWRRIITSLQRDPSRRLLLVALAGAALVAAPVFAAPKTYTVTIQQMAFGPLPTGLRAGDTIEWVNNDIFVHSATAKDKSFDVELKPKQHARTVLKTAGASAFYCRYHPGMTGRLVVAR